MNPSPPGDERGHAKRPVPAQEHRPGNPGHELHQRDHVQALHSGRLRGVPAAGVPGHVPPPAEPHQGEPQVPAGAKHPGGDR